MQIKKVLEAIAIASPLFICNCRGNFMAIGSNILYPKNISAEQKECIRNSICDYNLEKCYSKFNYLKYCNYTNSIYEPISLITIGRIQ